MTVWVRAVQLVLLVNALPAFIVLTSLPSRTDDLFVWTVKPDASAQLLAAMYGNAALLTLLTLGRKAWAEIRVAFVVFTLFAVAATIVTFFHLDPFLAHPRYFFVYWLVNYFLLFFLTPYVFWREERAHGGRLPIDVPLVRGPVGLAALACLAAGDRNVHRAAARERRVAVAHDAARRTHHRRLAHRSRCGFRLGDLGWRRRPGPADSSRQALPTAVLIGIVPLAHRDELTGGAAHWILFAALLAGFVIAGASGLRAPAPAGRATGPASSR